MNYRMLRYIIGWVLRFESGFLLLPALVGAYYKESEGWVFLAVAIGALLVSFAMTWKKPWNTSLYAREGFVSVSMGWLVMSAVGALPFVITGEIPSFVDAMFETVSGFTTTGASILSSVEGMCHCCLFWRSFTHWIGGMGVFVFIMAVLPLLGVGGSDMNLMRAESPGPSVGKFVPRIRTTAMILYGIYIGITLTEMVLLVCFKMPLFDAACATFGTVGTGGFGIKNDSFASYAPALQNIVTIFMIMSGINFGFYFLLLRRKIGDALRMEEVRAYLAIIAVTTGIVCMTTFKLYDSLATTLRQGAFQVASIITTTGFATTDFNLWPELPKTVLIILMFVGACAGSTGGGMKVSRMLIMAKTIRKELSIIVHPREIKRICMDGHPIEHETVRATNVFVAIYFCVFMLSVLILGIDDLDFTTNFTAVAATFNNIGPGLELVGPTSNYGLFSNPCKIVLIIDMLAGRLELFPVLLLLKPETWKRR